MKIEKINVLKSYQKMSTKDLILSSMTEGVIVLDKKSKIVIINDSAKSYLNLKNKSYSGKRIQDIVKIPKFVSFVKKLLKHDKVLIQELKIKKNPDKSFLVNGNILKGKGTNVLIVMNDITKLKQLEKVRQQFVANVSHELKTPITSIVGYLETLKQHGIPSKKKQLFLKKALKHSNRLNSIIDDLLWLSLIESKEEDKNFHLYQQPILQVLQGAIDDAQPIKNKNNIKLNCDDTIQVRADAQLLREAIINLIANAIKYGDSHSDITLTVTQNFSAHRTEVSVHNFGEPIPEKYKETIFHRFSRVDKGRSREKGGTGLGLAIVKHIIFVHDGDVTFCSSLNEGTTFTISLPLI